MNALTNILDYLELCGGSEHFEFWTTKDNRFVRDTRGNLIPDFEAAYEFGHKLRSQHPDLEIEISSNIVRIKTPVVSGKLS